jgi:hypothetical protein
MAEIFASASAAVGVAAAGGQLFDGIAKLSAICLEVRDIPADIRSAVDDLSALSEVLDSTQLEIDQDTLLRTLDPTVSKKVLAGLQQNSQSVSNMLHVMETNVKEKKLWGRIKAVGKKKKLGKSLSRSQSDQILLLLALATDNRYEVWLLCMSRFD